MPIPPNTVPENALVISALPYSLVVPDVLLSPQSTAYPTTCDTTGFHPLWWTYTPPAGQTYIAFLATGNGTTYFPQLSLFTGTAPSLLQYNLNAEQFFCGARGLNYWWTVPVTPLTTYHIRFTDFAGTAPASATLTVNFVSQPFTLAPAGSLVIPDDAPYFPANILSILQEGALLQTPALLVGEFGASLPGGQICGSTGQGGLAANSIDFYSATWALVVRVALPEAPDCINANETNFYVVAGATLYEYSAVGVQLRTWTPTALSTNDGFLIVNRAGTRAYYSSGIENTNVRTWNLDTNTAGATLYTIANDRQLQGNDGGTLANGNLWYLDESQVTLLDNHLRIYDTAGVQQADYTVTTGADRVPHAAYYPGTGTAADPESIWVWIYKNSLAPLNIYEFTRVKVSDGTTVETFQVPGTSTSGEPADPNVSFAVSNSCPFIVLRVALEPQNAPAGEAGSEEYGTLTEMPIRWVLRTPVLG